MQLPESLGIYLLLAPFLFLLKFSIPLPLFWKHFLLFALEFLFQGVILGEQELKQPAFWLSMCVYETSRVKDAAVDLNLKSWHYIEFFTG